MDEKHRRRLYRSLSKGFGENTREAADRSVATYNDPLCPMASDYALRDTYEQARDAASCAATLLPPLSNRFPVFTHEEELMSIDRRFLLKAINRALTCNDDELSDALESVGNWGWTLGEAGRDFLREASKYRFYERERIRSHEAERGTRTRQRMEATA